MEMTSEIINGITISVILSLQLIGVAIAATVDRNLDTRRRAIMLSLLALSFLLLIQNYAEYVLVEWVFAPKWRIFVAAFGYSIRPAIIVLFVYMVAPTGKHWWTWILVGINAVMHFTAFFTSFVFTISDANSWAGGPLSNLCLIVSSILLVYHIFVAVREFRGEKKIGTFMPIPFALLVVGGIVADIFKYYPIQHWVDYVTVTVVACCVFYYLWLHFIFVRRYQNAILAEQRFNMMLSQMQPHFIYNSLSAIAEMDGMPDSAQKAILDFSKYLRENLDASTSSELVTFAKELEHIKKYISLEILRFGEKVKVIYDVRCDAFLLPALTVQMLVENAVKHGITKRYEGGTVTITAVQEGENYVVTVADDGVGFDPERDLSGGHFGINNVRKRLEYAIGGTLQVVSEMGKGTVAIVTVPKVKKEARE